MFSLIKLEFKKSNFRLKNLKERKIFNLIIVSIISVLLFGIAFYSVYLISNTFYKLDLEKIYITIIFFLLFLVTISYQLKQTIVNIYNDKDKNIYKILPINKSKIYLSKIIAISLKQFLIVLIFLSLTILPLLVKARFNYIYYIKLLSISILYIIVSPVISVILIKPIIFFYNVINKKILFKLLFILTTVAVLFSLYIVFSTKVVNLINQTGSYINDATRESIKNLDKYFYFTSFLSTMFLEDKFSIFILKSFIILIVLITLFSISIFLLYKFNKNVEIKTPIKKYKPEKILSRKPLRAIIVKDLKYILRDDNYLFQVLILNLLMPLFILLTGNIIVLMSRDSIGQKAILSFILLTIFIFILLISSYQSNLISNDYKTNHLLKIIPIKYKTIIFTKLSIVLVINMIVVLLSLILLMAFKYISFLSFLLLLCLSILFLIGYSFMQVNSDMLNTKYVDDNSKNIAILNNLFTGIIIGVLISTLLLVANLLKTANPGEFYIPISVSYIVIIGLSFLFCLINILIFIFRRKNI